VAHRLIRHRDAAAIPGVAERLVADPPARVADAACGVGWAGIAIARAYPSVRVDGFDIDASVELANRNARDAGVSDRVTFRVRDVADADAGAYDLAVIIEAIHDMTQPAGVLASARRMLRAGGSLLVADEKSEDAFTAPGGDLERFFYGFSILTCLPAAMTERPTAAIGTVIRPDTMARLAAEAGSGASSGWTSPRPRPPLLPDDGVRRRRTRRDYHRRPANRTGGVPWTSTTSSSDRTTRRR
jgi:2-polyprenyl-3-methyl-5-hydroxy-6-metoxy-1,4-benzoquinol methylase